MIETSRVIVCCAFATVIPTNKTACQGDFTTFWCTRRFGSTIFWFVDDQPINSLPKVYGAVSTSFVSVGELSSKLRILALEETNNSMITCAVASSTKISNFTEPVYLTGIWTPKKVHVAIYPAKSERKQ